MVRKKTTEADLRREIKALRSSIATLNAIIVQQREKIAVLNQARERDMSFVRRYLEELFQIIFRSGGNLATQTGLAHFVAKRIMGQ